MVEKNTNPESDTVDRLLGENITPEGSISPIYLVPLTAEEEAERKDWAIRQLNYEAEEDAKLTARQSALAKLALLGLTEEEAKAVIGL